MSTAVAAAAAPTLAGDHSVSARSYPALAPSTAGPSIESADTTMSDAPARSIAPNSSPTDGKRSPNSYVGQRGGNGHADADFRLRNAINAKVIVKKEPGSPSIQNNARHRPRRLDLNTAGHPATTPANSRPSGGPLTGREALVMHDVGIACLSPGFQTQDPTMREQLQRSISVRDQQRSIIEARLLKSAKGEGPEKSGDHVFGKGGPQSAKKRPPPAGLSIVPPPAQQFAHERVIQSAPLHQSFTGRNQAPPPVRQASDRQQSSSAYSQGPPIQHVPAVQTNNRLPPISDVFGADALQPNSSRPPFPHTNSTPHFNGPPLPSPGFPPQTAHPHVSQGSRPREYRSAEEAVHEMTGGREDLQPRLIRYGIRQPPTPPSPRHDGSGSQKPQPAQQGLGLTGHRRSRHEYEAGSSPPLGAGREQAPRTGPFGEGRDSPATQRAKKEEFLGLCARAWDLFHS